MVNKVAQTHSYSPLRKYQKGPHEVFSRSWTHFLYFVQCDKYFIPALQVENPSKETAPQIFYF